MRSPSGCSVSFTSFGTLPIPPASLPFDARRVGASFCAALSHAALGACSELPCSRKEKAQTCEKNLQALSAVRREEKVEGLADVEKS